MDEPRIKGYSLWLMPAGESYWTLATLINNLSRQFGTPLFEPHVTLLGQLEGDREDVLAKASLLATRLRSFTVRLKAPSFQADYFRSLFFKIERDESLLAARRAAERVFNLPSGEKSYWPHLSLLYGHLPPRTKEQILDRLPPPEKAAFEVRRLHVFLTEGGPQEWFPIRGFDLVGEW